MSQGARRRYGFRVELDLDVEADFGRGLREELGEGREALAVGRLLFGILLAVPAGRVHATDATNAARTLLYNIRKGVWDADICALLGVPMAGGGKHPLMGTHNRLIGLGDLYLEVISIDPDAPPRPITASVSRSIASSLRATRRP